MQHLKIPTLIITYLRACKPIKIWCIQWLQAGDLFSVADQAIVNDLTEVVNTISEITSLPDYVNNDNDQSVVEICITRVTSAIR